MGRLASTDLNHDCVEQRRKAPLCSDSLTLPVTSVLPTHEADESHVSRLLVARTDCLSFPSLRNKAKTATTQSSTFVSAWRLCTQSHTFVAQRVSSARPAGCLTPACCFSSKPWPSLGKLNAPRKYHWGNKSVERAYWSATFVFNVRKGDSFVLGWHQALATVGSAHLGTLRSGASELSLQNICLLQEELKEPRIHQWQPLTWTTISSSSICFCFNHHITNRI